MKKIVIPMMLLSASAFANVAELNYQPKAGMFHLSSELIYTAGEATVKSSGSTIDVEKTNYDFNNHFSYGIMDNFSVGLGLNYSFVADTEQTVSGTTETDKLNGMKDPLITATYRLMDEKAPVIVDLNAEILLGFSDKENDAKRGGYAIKIGADTSKKWGAFELFGALNLNYLMESTDDDKAANEKTTADPSYDIELAVKGQYMLAESMYVNFGIDYTMVGEVDADVKEDSGNEYTSNDEAYNVLGLEVGGKYAFNKDLAMNLGFRMTQTDDYKLTEVDSGTTTEYDISDVSDYSIKLGVDYSF